MFEFMKPLRAGAIGLGAVALALGASMSATAQSSPDAAAAAEVSESPAADAQIVVKDGDTGKLRAATPEEARAMHAGRANARAGRRGASRDPAVPGPGGDPAAGRDPVAGGHGNRACGRAILGVGAQGGRRTDEFMSFTVVVKRADGKLVELCVEGAETTAKVVASVPQFKPATLPTE